MAKVFLMCGKICSGKSTHAEELRKEHRAVVLSVDEITLALFGGNPGEKLDEYVEKSEEYLYRKSLDILEMGINVVLDWGFWTKRERDYARNYYGSRDIAYEFHYIDISEQEWHRRLQKRNQDIKDHKIEAYFVDDGLAAKFEAIFEKPDDIEMDQMLSEADNKTTIHQE